MPDERQESTREGVAPAPESEVGRKAEEKLQRKMARTPRNARPDSAMGGTSDADRPADQAELERLIREREERRG